MLRGDQLVPEVLPALFGLGGRLGAVHPQEGGGLVRRETHLRPDGVELPHLGGHLVEAGSGDEHLAEAVLGG
jgi:hypothetical protein